MGHIVAHRRGLTGFSYWVQHLVLTHIVTIPEMVGTAVLRIVVSSESMKKATATSHGKRRLEACNGPDKGG
jgi:hypothetical protein